MDDPSQKWFEDNKPVVDANQVYSDVLHTIMPLLSDGQDQEACIVVEMSPSASLLLTLTNENEHTVRQVLSGIYPYLRFKTRTNAPLKAYLDTPEYSHQVKVLNMALTKAENALTELRTAVSNFHGRYY